MAERDVDWSRLDPLLDRLLALPPEDLPGALDALAPDEQSLRPRLEAALAAAKVEGGLFAQPAAARWAPLLAAPAPPTVSAGTRFGAWEIEGELGQGGMGTVHAVRRADGAYEQHAALKILSAGADQSESRVRFVQERQILARLEHPGIARLLDGGVAPDGRPWLVLERVDGVTITAFADERGLDVESRLGLFLAALSAVAFAHRNLVVHRDLKPSNILVTGAGEVKLLDFGIAKLLDRGNVAERTRVAAPLTPQYAAPEQITGDAITTATDVYSMGLVLYELLAGVRPYRVANDSASTLERAILESDPRPLSAAVRDATAVAFRRATTPDRLARRLTGDLEAIVAKALAKAPGDRYPSADALAREIQDHLAGRAILARAEGRLARVRRFARRHRVGVAASAALAVALLAGLVALGFAFAESRARLAEARRAEAIQAFLVDLFSEIDPERARGREVLLREVVDRGAARLATELRDQPSTRAELLVTLGAIYRRLALYPEAERLLEEALALARHASGGESPHVARALVALGDLDYWRDDFERALDRQRSALAIFAGAGEPYRAEAASAEYNVGATLRQLGRFDEALAAERRALALERDLHGEESLAYADVAAGLALVLHNLERSEEAILHAERALAIRRRLLPEDHPGIADSLESLGLARMSAGESSPAVAALEESLAIRRMVFGKEHPAILEGLNSLASAYEDANRLEEALALRAEALPLARSVFPAGNDSLAVHINNFATVAFRLGRFTDAVAGFHEAAAIWRVTAGERSTRMATVRNNLGFALLELGRPEEALRELEAAVEIRTELLGADSAEVAKSLRIRGLATLALGDRAAARIDLDRAVALSRTAYPARHLRLAEALASRARLAVVEGRTADARRDLEEALSIRQEKLGVESSLSAELRAELANLFPN